MFIQSQALHNIQSLKCLFNFSRCKLLKKKILVRANNYLPLRELCSYFGHQYLYHLNAYERVRMTSRLIFPPKSGIGAAGLVRIT
jgi:hypothetical protein